MESSKRLFIGLELPAEAKDSLLRLDPGLPKLRWLPAEQMHMTLSFLGEVEGSAHERLKEVLAGVRVPPFFLPLRGLGSFSAKGQPSVVWVGTGQGHPHLFALHKHVQDAVLHAGLQPDLRPFRPHVTVARARGITKQMLQPLLREHRETELGLVRVEDYTLFSSVLSPEGATHEVELRIPF